MKLGGAKTLQSFQKNFFNSFINNFRRITSKHYEIVSLNEISPFRVASMILLYVKVSTHCLSVISVNVIGY